jgi:hypothetical protein
LYYSTVPPQFHTVALQNRILMNYFCDWAVFWCCQMENGGKWDILKHDYSLAFPIAFAIGSEAMKIPHKCSV